MSRTTTLENRFYDSYVQYFALAERTRRWSPWEDIPWEQANKQPNEDVLRVAEAFFGVELYLPDYTARLLEMIRKSRGRHLFQAQWGFEEARHGLAIGEWLKACGAYDERKLHDYEDALLAEKWTPPYDDPLHMIAYTVLQEYATRLNYSRLREYASKVGYVDPAFDKTFLLLARDEAAHFGFFQKGMKSYLELYRDEALEALNRVITDFQMPARAQVPRWAEREQHIMDLEIFTPRIYMKDVVQPCLRALGVDRADLREARKRMMAAEAAEAATPTQPAASA